MINLSFAPFRQTQTKIYPYHVIVRYLIIRCINYWSKRSVLILFLLLFLLISKFNLVETTTSPAGYTNYQESSTDNCTGTASICTEQLPFNITNPPDVWLDARVTVPSIVLRVDNIQARLNLDARVASLVNLTAGVSVSISSVQLTILSKIVFLPFHF